MERFFRILLLLSMLAYPVYAQDRDQMTIAVLDLEMTGGVSEAYSRPFSDRLRQELLNTGSFVVVERNNMESILEEQGFQLSGCTSDECAVEVGRMLGVERMLAGSLGIVGSTHTLNVRMIDVETGRILTGRSVDCACPIDEVLTTRIREIAYLLSTGETQVQRMTGYGDLFITSTPAGASIRLDGIDQQGVTPTSLEGVDAGQHILELEKDDYYDSRSITVIPGTMTRVNAEMQRGNALVRVYSTPYNADLYIDSRYIGPTPQTVNDLPAGSHTIRVTYEGLADYENVHSLNPGENRIDIALHEPASLTIQSQPEGAEVSIGYRSYGISPVTIDDIASSLHIVKLTHPYCFDWSTTVNLEEGGEQSINAMMEYRRSNIRVESNVQRGNLILDERIVSTSLPALLEGVPYGEHSIRVEMDGHLPYDTSFVLNQSRTLRIEANLQRETGFLTFDQVPGGTSIIVDDNEIGITPLNQYRLEIGSHRIELDNRQYGRRKRFDLTVDFGASVSIPFTYEPIQKSDIMWRSAVFPGWGQRYAGYTKRGWAYTIGEGVSLILLAGTIGNYNHNVDVYNDAREDYRNAVTPGEVLYTRYQMDEAYSDVEDSRSGVNGMVIISSLIYIVNLVDVYLMDGYEEDSSSASSYNPSEQRIQLTGFQPSGSNEIGVSLRFSLFE